MIAADLYPAVLMLATLFVFVLGVLLARLLG